MKDKEQYIVGRTGYAPEYLGNPQLTEGLEQLRAFRETQARIALMAAQQIHKDGGSTLDLPLYYAAMFGKDYSAGANESDPNLLLPQTIIGDLSKPVRQGQPILIRDVNFPEHNVTVGILDSFNPDAYQPVRLSVGFGELTNPEYNFYSWDGHLGIAVRKVIPVSNEGNGKWNYEVAKETEEVEVCKTGASLQTFNNGGIHFDVYPFIGQSSGGERVNTTVTNIWEAGDKVFLNAQFGKSLHHEYIRFLANERGIKFPVSVTFNESW
jgi:hypothetical protein